MTPSGGRFPVWRGRLCPNHGLVSMREDVRVSPGVWRCAVDGCGEQIESVWLMRLRDAEQEEEA